MMSYNEYVNSTRLDEMSNIKPKVSGLDNIFIYASTKDAVNGQHGPRIKVSNIKGKFDPSDNYSISLVYPFEIVAGVSTLKRSDQKIVMDWMMLNHNHLMDWWNGGVFSSERDFFNALVKH